MNSNLAAGLAISVAHAHTVDKGLATISVDGQSVNYHLLLAVSACGSVVRNADLSSTAKTMWVLVVVLFPIFGPIVYFSVRSDW